MNLSVSEENLPFFEALASEVRIRIIYALAERDRNIRELADCIGLSSAIMTMHIKKLEAAGIVKTNMTKRNGSIQKLCTLSDIERTLLFPKRNQVRRESYHFSIPVGQYTAIRAEPTCGLATAEKIIGLFDDPRYFLDPERVNAQILWFFKGCVEYKFPNFLCANQMPDELEISMELGSEAPGINSDWPSDLTFYLNGVRLCTWTSPGDFGDRQGTLTPSWWKVNQYGFLKVLRVTSAGTYLDGEKRSDVTIEQIMNQELQWSLKISVEDDAANVGGLTIFGRKFGNYNQDIEVTTYYRASKNIAFLDACERN